MQKKNAPVSKAGKGYIKEMNVWLEQQRCRRRSCELAIKNCDAQIINTVKLRKLEAAQMAIIKQTIKDSEKELAAYKKRVGSK